VLLAQNRLDEAVAEFRQASYLQPDSAETHLALTVALFDQGDLDGAIAEYRQAIRLGPEDAGAHVDLGLALYVKDDLDGAIAEYREAVRLNPKDPNSHFLLGNALAKKPDLEAVSPNSAMQSGCSLILPRRTMTWGQHWNGRKTSAQLWNSTKSPTALSPIISIIGFTTSICRMR